MAYHYYWNYLDIPEKSILTIFASKKVNRNIPSKKGIIDINNTLHASSLKLWASAVQKSIKAHRLIKTSQNP